MMVAMAFALLASDEPLLLAPALPLLTPLGSLSWAVVAWISSMSRCVTWQTLSPSVRTASYL